MHLKDAVAVVYGDSVRCNLQNIADVILADVSLLYTSDEKVGAEVKVSKNKIPVDMTRQGDKKCYEIMTGLLSICADGEESG